MRQSAPATCPGGRTTAPTIPALLRDRLVHPVFQPIVDLTSGAVVAMEALARGPAGTALEYPDALFAAAHAAGRLGELDMLCFERALECAMAAPTPPPLLFANAEPAVLNQPITPRITELVSSGLPFRYILEFTERALAAVPGSLIHLAGMVHDQGNAIALDDVGVDPTSLAFLPVLEPEVIKLDMSLVHDPHAEHTHQVCAVVQEQARRTGAVVIAEGIETEEHLRTARALGAHWGQGWLFGRPTRIDGSGYRFDTEAGSALRPSRPDFHRRGGSPFEVAAGHGQVVAASAEAIAIGLARLGENLTEDIGAAVIVASNPDPGIPQIPGTLEDLADLPRSIILLDDPVPGEFAVTLIGPGYGRCLCVRLTDTLELVVVDHLPAVAEITRMLLSRLGPGRLAERGDQPSGA